MMQFSIRKRGDYWVVEETSVSPAIHIGTHVSRENADLHASRLNGFRPLGPSLGQLEFAFSTLEQP